MAADSKYTFAILGSDQTKKAFASINAGVRKTINVAGAMGAGVAAGLAVMVTKSIEAASEMSRLAESVNVGTQTMSEWSHAASTVNVESTKMADIFKDVQDKIGDFATTGGGGAADLFKQLNLDVKDFIGLAPDKQLLKIGNALDSVGSQSQKVFFLESLAGDASKLLPLLEDNAEGLKRLQIEAQDLGISISDIEAAKLEAANRSMERVQGAMTGFANQVAIPLAPIIEEIANQFIGAATEGETMSKAIKKGFEVGAKVIGVFADGVHGIKIGFKGLEIVARGVSLGITTAFGKVATMLNDKFRNALIDGVFLPIRTVLQLLGKVSPVAREVLADVDDLVKKVKGSADSGFQGVIDRQKAAFDQARAEFQTLILSDLPSHVIDAKIAEILEKAEIKATETAARLRAKAQSTDIGGAGATAGDEQIAKEQAKFIAKLERLDAQYLTELQQLQMKFADEMLLIQQAEDQKLLTEETANEKRLRALKAFEEAKTSLVKKNEQSRSAISQIANSRMLSELSRSSRTAFKVQKAAAISEAAMNIPLAASKAFASAKNPYVGAVLAAIAVAAEISHLNSIKSQSFGGGAMATSGGGAAVGGAGAAPSIPDITSFSGTSNSNTEPGKSLVIHINGDVVSDDQSMANWLIDKIKPAIDDRDAVLFDNPNSAQVGLLLGG